MKVKGGKQSRVWLTVLKALGDRKITKSTLLQKCEEITSSLYCEQKNL